MRHNILISFIYFVSIILTSGSAFAAPFIIHDNYIGGGVTDQSWYGADVVGDPKHFDISHMSVDLNGSLLTVDIFSTYFKNVGMLNTVLGDLFISTDGWSPYGDGPYLDDTAFNGEKWELALTLDNHGGTIGTYTEEQDFRGESGVATLYEVIEENILMTNVIDNEFRADQVSQYDGSSQSALAQGSWSINGILGSDYDQLTFVINLAGLNLVSGADLGFSWNMTCGNDIIQGLYSLPFDQTAFTPVTQGNIPEPSSILLLGLALPFYRRLKTIKAKAY